ncbi:MAG: glycosyltransferase [Elusimicrobiales bacterium]|nr:glycosyltransferase [Elusimicrobiales bacterium]
MFLDYRAAYRDRGYRGAQACIRDFIAANGIKILFVAAEPASFHFPLEFFRSLRPAVYTAMLAGDSVYYYGPRDRYYAGAMDLLVSCDSFETAEAFKALGGDAVMFPSACDRGLYRKLPGLEKTIDVSFVGGLAGRRDRAAYLDYLAANGVEVRVYGSGTPGGRVSQAQMVEIFNQSRINLNFTGASVDLRLAAPAPLPPDTKQLKARLAELALCGSFVLSERAPGIERVFRPGEEAVYFDTKEDLLEKTRFYLARAGEREAIAARGYRRALSDYDAGTAIPRLLGEIEARRQAPKTAWSGIPADAVFNKNFASFRVLCLLRHLKRLKFSFALEELLLLVQLRTLDPRQVYDFFIVEIVDKFPRAKALLKKLLLRP